MPETSPRCPVGTWSGMVAVIPRPDAMTAPDVPLVAAVPVVPAAPVDPVDPVEPRGWETAPLPAL